MVFADIGQSMRFFDVDESGKAALHPEAKRRKCHLCVDALSAKMWRSLNLALTKKLSKLNSAE